MVKRRTSGGGLPEQAKTEGAPDVVGCWRTPVFGIKLERVPAFLLPRRRRVRAGGGAVNALSNIKRALHQTVDSLLQSYGLLARNRRLSFPMKLELIDAAGLFSLSILKTLNNERNLVEHDYRVPTRARAQEALDVVRLWLLATRRLSEFVVYESLAGWRADGSLGVVQLNPALGLLEFFKVTGPTHSNEFEGRSFTFLQPIRLTSGGLISGVEIDTKPLWSIALSYRNRADWQYLIRPVVALNGTDTGSTVQ